MGRDVPYEEDSICDCCGQKGAWDFMGDLLCTKCFQKYNVGTKEKCDLPRINDNIIQIKIKCPYCGGDISFSDYK